MRYRLRTLFVLITFIVSPLAWYANRVQVQSAAVVAIRRAQGGVTYSYRPRGYCRHNQIHQVEEDSWFERAYACLPIDWRDSVVEIRLENQLPSRVELSNIARLSQVMLLQVENVDLDSESLRLLCASPKLSEIHFGDCRIEKAGILKLCSEKKLRRLSLEGVKIDHSTMRAISEIDSLQMLSLKWSEFTAEGIAELGRLSQLDYLELQGTNTGYDVLQEIAAWNRRPTLGLEDTEITDECLTLLKKVRIYPDELEATSLSDEALLELKIHYCLEPVSKPSQHDHHTR